jgi:maltose/maltodextrin transport system substrate-binding protein
MRSIAFISAVVCVLSLPCCRSSNNPGAVVTVWAAMEAGEIRALTDIADRFERETGTSVRIVPIGLFEIVTKLELAAPAGKGPDIISISHTSVGTLALMGLLQPMDRFSGLLARCPGPFVEAYRYRGVLLGVPLTVESYGLVTNERLVARVPATWEDLFDEAARLTKDTDGDGTPDVYGFLTDPTNFYFTFPFYDARGAYIFGDRGPAGHDTTDLGFCTAGGIRALTLLTDLTRRSHLIPVGITYPIITDLFGRGKLGMTIYGTYLIPSWEGSGMKVGYHELPPFADGSRGRPLATLMGLGVSAYADHPGPAGQFIEYLLSPENLRRFFEGSGGTLVMADPGVYREEDFAKVPYLRTALAVASDSYPFPNDPEGDLVWEATSGAASAALSGAVSPQKALCDMQKRLAEVIGEMRR